VPGQLPLRGNPVKIDHQEGQHRRYDQPEYEPFWAAAAALVWPCVGSTAYRRQGRIRGAGEKTLTGGGKTTAARAGPTEPRRTERRRQTPRALITASNTFAIREVPKRRATLATVGDLRRINLAPVEEYLEGVESGRIRSLPGFSRARGHFEPDSVNDRATDFVRDLLAERVDQEIQELYEAVNDNFGLRRREIGRESKAI
jgi:hypothetical protein